MAYSINVNLYYVQNNEMVHEFFSLNLTVISIKPTSLALNIAWKFLARYWRI